MHRPGLTKRQRQILEYIHTCVDEKHYPPSVREIGKAMGLSSPSTVQVHLNTLEEKGYIKRDSAKSRSMVITDKASEALGVKPLGVSPEGASHHEAPSVVEVPLVGRVAAGMPILAEQNIEDQVPLPAAFFGDDSSFLLTVHGESMIEAGILDGDVLVVREQDTADNGQIVVALLDDGATVKTFYREKDCIRLQPQNSSMEPIYTRDAKIMGVVTGLFRSL